MSELTPTEARNARTRGLDTLSTRELVAVLIDEQVRAAAAVRAAAGAIERVVGEIVERLKRSGRVHYVGAGTSGRLGVLDASEIPPTFGAEPDLICAHIAGGDDAVRRAVEGAEDDRAAGAAAMRGHVAPDDVVIGVSASGGAPFVLAALDEARAIGAFTAALVSVQGSPLVQAADAAIVVETGAEAIAGSTRLGAGTAHKIALNVISTAAMVRLGKVYDHLMVDLVASNDKLRRRAQRLIAEIAGVDDERAQTLLARADGRVKVAIVMAKRGLDADAARALLERHAGVLRACI